MFKFFPFKNVFVHWDADGCQVDSEPVHVMRWNMLAATYGVDLQNEHFDQTHSFEIFDRTKQDYVKIARPLRGAHEDVICYWIMGQMRRQGMEFVPDLETMKKDLAPLYARNAHLITPRDGIPQLIEKLHSQGAAQSTVTSCPTDIATINMEKMGNAFKNCMSFMITSDDTPEHKPHPMPYAMSVERFAALVNDGLPQVIEGVDPAKVSVGDVNRASIGVDDSPSGTLSSLRNGMRTVQFLNPGQEPFDLGKHNIDPKLLRVARSATEVEEHIDYFRKDIVKSFERSHIPASPGKPCFAPHVPPQGLARR